MITPLDIQNKEFSKSVRGYKEEEVDEFLDLLTLDFEKLINENKMLKAHMEKQERDIEKYRSGDEAVLATLEAAKKLMGDISQSAEKRAEILLKNAELDAELIQREARENVERLTEETINLKRRFADFRVRYKSLLEAELERFESSSEEIYSQYGMEELSELASTGSAHAAGAGAANTTGSAHAAGAGAANTTGTAHAAGAGAANTTGTADSASRVAIGDAGTAGVGGVAGDAGSGHAGSGAPVGRNTGVFKKSRDTKVFSQGDDMKKTIVNFKPVGKK